MSLTLPRFTDVRLWFGLLAVAAMLAALPPEWSAALLIATAFGLTLVIWPVAGLFALALVIPFSAVARTPLGPASVGVTDIMLGAAALAWFWRRAVERPRPPLAPAPLLWIILPLAFALLYSTLPARSLRAAIPELVKWAEVGAAYFLGAQLLSPRLRLPFALTLLLAATVEALIGWRQFYFGIGPEAFELGRFLRAYGTFGQPNPYAGYLGLSLPLGLALGLWSVRRLWRSRSRDLTRLFLSMAIWGMTITILAGILASGSRGAWLGVIASTIAVLALDSLASRALLLLGAGATALAAPLLPSFITARLAAIPAYFGVWNARGAVVTDENFAILERVAHWQAGWEMFADNFWLGVGVGNWDIVYPQYAIDRWLDPLGHAHNALFHYAAVAGIFGALAYLMLWLGALTAAFRAVLRTRALARALAIGVVGLLVHLSVHNLIDNLWVQGMPLLVALALSLLPTINNENEIAQKHR
ncbi:MAG: hypothetical protein GXP42_19850 [Chloroflexi bacterium]|nr:hypothetical protein [Chloroflexota bacterium]